jgi:cell filamentation protein
LASSTDDGAGDPYLIPGTNTLRNNFNEKNPLRLAYLEALFSQARLAQPLAGVEMTAEGYCGLHKHLFQDIYPWAGEPRSPGRFFKGEAEFLEGSFVRGALARQFELLNKEKNLRGLSADDFAKRAAFHISELNHIHPFREGNGRTMRLFLVELGRQAGHQIDDKGLDREAWMAASIRGRAQDYAPMAAVIRSAIVGREQSAGVAASVQKMALDVTEAQAMLIASGPAALDQAAAKVAGLMEVRRADPRNPRLAELAKLAEHLTWLASDQGPRHQLALLRAAGVRKLEVELATPNTALDRVLAIGRSAEQAFSRLPEQVQAKAIARVLDRDRGR